MTVFYSAGIDTISNSIYGDFKSDIDGLTPELSHELGTAIMNGCRKELPGAFKLMKLFINIGSTLADDNKLIYIKGVANDFPFIQSYTTPELSRINFNDGSGRMNIHYISKEGHKIDKDSIVTGSSPNIIHHKDSQICAELLNITDYTVSLTHDCFYTNPANAGKLYEDVRTSFHNLFAVNDVLQDLCNQFNVDNTIEYGDLDVNAMLNNQYCFS